MKVIFLEDVTGSADAGEVKDVKNGYARNFLLPRKLATVASADNMQRIKSIEKSAQDKRVRFSKEWGTVAQALDGTHLVLEARIGPTGRLFGAITSRQIAEGLSKQVGRELDHHTVLLPHAIHEPGDLTVAVRLYRDVQAKVTVSVVPEGYQQAQAAAAADAAAGRPASAQRVPEAKGRVADAPRGAAPSPAADSAGGTTTQP